ncbi:acyltransferase [Marinobacterium sp. D7]|uniref:acyltransferase family protein n=1 Tax=Marinobacterium ramblicola TaxID=2849041 RepID=UPI001C2D49FD|nr:acyltransferase [Marinobacterium ramblicola]MBV1787191.1 acyltransferase [Marinobacterium ramblicola]
MNRSHLLDSLRILAIVLVFVAHLGQLLGHTSGDFFGWKNLYFVSLGGVGVTLFLLLSGILAGLSDTSRRVSYPTYLLRKVMRIYPAYWLSIPLAMLGYLLAAVLLEGDAPAPFPNGLITDLIGSFTGFYAWMGLWGGPYNPPSWFISLIMSLYTLSPFFLWSMKRWPHRTLAALLGISLGARYYVGQWGIPFVEQSLIDQMEGWLYRQYGFMPGRPGDWFPPCRFFEFGLGLYLARVLPNSTWFRLKLPAGNAIRVLSDLSFPLFLIHYPFLFLVSLMTALALPVGLAITIYVALMVALASRLNRLDTWVQRFGFPHPAT